VYSEWVPKHDNSYTFFWGGGDVGSLLVVSRRRKGFVIRNTLGVILCVCMCVCMCACLCMCSCVCVYVRVFGRVL
jgi:hypothetical protein